MGSLIATVVVESFVGSSTVTTASGELSGAAERSGAVTTSVGARSV